MSPWMRRVHSLSSATRNGAVGPLGLIWWSPTRTAACSGSTGFGFETPHRASTGYVLAKDAWGRGYATEALGAVVSVARSIGIIRLYALCHVENSPSWRVLEKCAFSREGVLRRHSEFPNLGPNEPCDVFCYALVLA